MLSVVHCYDAIHEGQRRLIHGHRYRRRDGDPRFPARRRGCHHCTEVDGCLAAVPLSGRQLRQRLAAACPRRRQRPRFEVPIEVTPKVVEGRKCYGARQSGLRCHNGPVRHRRGVSENRAGSFDREWPNALRQDQSVVARIIADRANHLIDERDAGPGYGDASIISHLAADRAVAEMNVRVAVPTRVWFDVASPVNGA